MKKYLIKYENGFWALRIKSLVKDWNSRFYVHQYHEQFQLIKRSPYKNKRPRSIKITKETARILISILDLRKERDSMLVHSSCFKRVVDINEELNRLSKIKNEHIDAIQWIGDNEVCLRAALIGKVITKDL